MQNYYPGIKVIQYENRFKDEWNGFIVKAKNSHFFFHRDYMEYHADRFQDYSLLIYDDRERLIALLPANKKDAIVYSHGGLTFGGFLVDERMTTATMLTIFSAVKSFLAENKIEKNDL